MIDSLHIKSFKIHSDLMLPLGCMTLLTGQNGMGKSSVIQALLLLRQSYVKNGGVEGANLKGDLVDLGCAYEVECLSSNDGKLLVEIGMKTSKKLTFCFSYDGDVNNTYLPAIGVPMSCDDIEACALFTKKFQYISAARFGPQRIYTRDTKTVEADHQISKVGGQCEYAVHFLNSFGNKIHCHPDLCFEGSENDLLQTQVQYWMQTISPRVQVSIQQNGADYKLNFKFSREENLITEEISAVNVGYGISYVLPILVAVLSAEPGALILIENPEAHIHPRAQAELMKLLMKAAKVGVQIVLETHSDHIINGALVAIAKDNSCINLVKAFYFERNNHLHTSLPTDLKILPDGRILDPPEGFFDQIDLDMRTLMGF